MKIRWSPEAEADLEDIWRYIAKERPRAADLVEDRIIHAVEQLVDFPFRGREGERAGTRELPVKNTSHRVVYRLDGLTIEIVRLWHMSRDVFR